MYTPIQIGIPTKFKHDVVYEEYAPQRSADTVFCFWSLYTHTPLKEDFHYLVLPDGCGDLVFDVSEHSSFPGGLVMTPSTTTVSINLGKSFSYTGIRMWPGAWLASPFKFVGKHGKRSCRL